MGLFTRRTRPADANTATAVGGGNGQGTVREKPARTGIMGRRERKHTGTGVHSNGTLNSRPKFGQWIKVTWPDLLTMVIMGVIGLGVSLSVTKSFDRSD